MSSQPTDAEMSLCRAWFDEHLNRGVAPPVSFVYGERPGAELVAGWLQEHHEALMGDGLRRTLVWTDPATGLRVELQARCFSDFPAVEWVVSLTNTGAAPTPIIADLQPLDCAFADLSPNTVLHWSKGSDCDIEDFAPQQATFYNHPSRTLASSLGRSSYHALPFFNLESGDHGLIGAIGWTGSWQADFSREAEGFRVRAGMQKTHLSLQPGETIRTPRIVLLFWEGEPLHGHNMLRRLILRHYTPRPNGEALRPPVCNAVWGENTAEQQIAKARWWKEHDLPLEYYWIDAGWYGDGAFREDSTVFNSEWWKHVGNWWPNRGPYPEGLKPVGDALREMGLGFVLWVEPERVFEGTHFTREHPEWLLGPIGTNYLYNLGLPEARQAMTDLLSSLITEAGVTCYRQDFNTDPAPFWEAADAPDRVGMSEIRHIEGLYQMWDELLARHPGLIIDNCSSGGRRIDLEMISRSIALWRSDYQCFPGFDPVGLQGQTQGLGRWVPLSAGVCDHFDTYSFRSGLSAAMVITTNIFERDAVDFAPPDELREMMRQHLRLRPYFSGDFTPLLPYSLDNEGWAAWQFHREDLAEGCVIAFRRPQSPVAAITMQLRGLDAGATYVLEDLDAGAMGERTGAELAEGMQLAISSQPGTKVLVYRRL
jgi:alpha-galactosidase